MGQIWWRKSKCKGPEAGLRLTRWSNSLETSQAIMREIKEVKGDQGKAEGPWEQGVPGPALVLYSQEMALSSSIPQSSCLWNEGLDGTVLPHLGLCHF